MEKDRTTVGSKGTGFSPREAWVSGLKALREVLADARIALHELVVAKGLEVFATMLEEDRTTLCGPPH